MCDFLWSLSLSHRGLLCRTTTILVLSGWLKAFVTKRRSSDGYVGPLHITMIGWQRVGCCKAQQGTTGVLESEDTGMCPQVNPIRNVASVIQSHWGYLRSKELWFCLSKSVCMCEFRSHLFLKVASELCVCNSYSCIPTKPFVDMWNGPVSRLKLNSTEERDRPYLQPLQKLPRPNSLSIWAVTFPI